MTEVEKNLPWPESSQNMREHVLSFDQAYAEMPIHGGEDFSDIPMIIVESNQQSEHTDAPIVIYPNDPSVVGAEEVVEEDDGEWGINQVAKEEEVVPLNESFLNVHQHSYSSRDDFSDIPLNDESYATFHPFPCDFCARRFKKKANLINHMVAHQTQRPHCCNICSSRFMRKCDLVNHQKIHSYIPNRDNRDDLENEPGYLVPTQKTSRRRSSHTGRKRTVTETSEGSVYRPSTVDEDVKLLLDMSSKLEESRRAEGGGGSSLDMHHHMRQSGVEGKPYVCTKCNRCFARESAMVSHSQVHAEDSSHDCTKCGSRFFTLDLLKDHYSRKHAMVYNGDSSDDSDGRGWYTGDERFGAFHCDICNIRVHKIEELREHKKTHTQREDYDGLFTCKVCQSMYLTNEKLLDHLEKSVNCQKNVCLLCADTFEVQSQVKEHIAQFHRYLPLHTCKICGKQCKDPKYLSKHYKLHGNNKRESLPPVPTHSRRTRKSSNTPVQCEECDEEFPDRRSLAYHRSVHNPKQIAGQRRFLCGECGKTFSSRSSQQIHNRIHTGERPYGCRYCWKAFADGGTLRKHERIHTGEKPYVCAVCPRAFNQRVVLREHIRSHHSGSTSKIGYSAPVYACPVCDMVVSGSEDLAGHIVKHSDDNTVRNRTPHSTGSARSHRRRKRPEPPPTAESYRLDEFDEEDFFYKDQNSSTESVASEEKKETPRKRSSGSRRTNSYTKISKTIDAAMKNIASLVDAPVRKAKMINSKLQSTGKVVGKKGAKKRGRRGGDATKAVVTILRPRVRTLSGRLSGRRDSTNETIDEEKVQDVAVDAVDGNVEQQTKNRVVRPRTKNVSYETLRALSQGLPSATFPDVKKVEAEDGGKSGSSIKVEKIEATAEDSYICGICSVVFNSKADLLFHVPVHI